MARHYFHWLATLQGEGTPLADGLPWMSYELIGWLDSFLQPHMRVFEWGAGGSTVFIARRVQSVISMEYDAEWHAALCQRLLRSEIRNVRLIFCAPTESSPGDGSYTSTIKRYAGLNFYAYVSAIDAYPDASFDLVVVDGRARPGCCQHARAKLRAGGCLLLDDSDRASYAASQQTLEGWDRTRFYGPGPYHKRFHPTTYWRKPA